MISRLWWCSIILDEVGTEGSLSSGLQCQKNNSCPDIIDIYAQSLLQGLQCQKEQATSDIIQLCCTENHHDLSQQTETGLTRESDSSSVMGLPIVATDRTQGYGLAIERTLSIEGQDLLVTIITSIEAK